MNLQTKIQLPIMLLIILMAGISGYVSYQKSSQSLYTALVDNMSGETDALVRAIDLTTESALADIKLFADRTLVQDFYKQDFRNKQNAAAFSGLLKKLSDTYVNFERLSLMDEKGIIIASSDASTVGNDFSSRAYFQAAITGKAFLAPPFRSSVTKKAVMATSAPVTLDGKIVGVAYGILSLEQLYKKAVEPIRIGARGYGYVLNSDGQIVLHQKADVILNPSIGGMENYKTMATASKDGILDFTNYSGAHVFAYYAKHKPSGLTAVVQAEYGDVFSSLADMRNSSLVISIVSILLASLLIFLILRPVLRDINLGMRFAGQVAAGDLSGTLSVQRKDELGKLANALRAIPESLKRITEEYRVLEKNMETGRLDSTADASLFSGEFANLVQGTNAILDRFRLVVDNIPSPTVMLDKDLRIRYMNAIARELVRSDYQGKTCGEVFRRDDDKSATCALTRAASTKKTCHSETRAHPGGRDMDISYTSIPMLDAQGNLVSVLQLIIDLTQIKNTQRTIMDVATQALDIANRVAAASEELSAQVEEVSRGTDVQRDRVGSTVTAMEEMNTTVMEVARNSGQASEQAEATRSRAAHGAELVDKVIAAVKHVNTVALELENNMQELGKQAEAIGGVMNVISDIADQTNLLALNAAIEAARAGEAGRGFAVVADEVRKLAEKTMSATTEVGSSIKGIQSATAANIRRVGDAGKSVSDATELAGTSGEALHEIVNLAGQNAATIAGIATAAEQQSATSEEINRSVEEINRIATDTASGMSESASAVQELSRMSQELKQLLDKLQA